MAGGRGKIDEVNKLMTPEERKARASKAGKASGEARRQQKSMSELARSLLDLAVKNKGELKDIEDTISLEGLSKENMTVRLRLLLTLTKKALDGDIKAIEMLTTLSGDKVEKQEVNVTSEKPLVQVYLPSNGRD